jgi:ureidoglycolate dehydrogenase (NAD+)
MLMGGSAGGFRGFSLSLWTEALALLNGNPFISGSENVPEEEKGPMHELGLQSFTLLVIDAAAFTDDPGSYMREVGSMLSWVQSSATLPGVDRIRIPGDRGAAALDECRRHGVPLDAQKWDSIVSLSQTAGLELPVTL